MRNQLKHSRVMRVVHVFDIGISAVGSGYILHKVVCSDAEKVAVLRKRFRNNGACRCFNHDAERQLFAKRLIFVFKLFPDLIDERTRLFDFRHGGYHRQHYLNAFSCCCKQNRFKLLAKYFRVVQAKANPAVTEERIFLRFHIKIRKLLVAADIKRSYGDRARIRHVDCRFVGFRLLRKRRFFALRRIEKFRAEQTDAAAVIAQTYDTPPLAYVRSYGCQQNVNDGEKIRGVLMDIGFGACDSVEQADLILFNTCAVREHAEQRVFGNVGALKKLKEKGGICGVHCENAGVIDALIAEKKASGENGVHCHPETRPDIMEAEAVGRLLRIAEQVDVPVVIVHTTNIEALDEIANARWRGQKVFVETCPQYLVLDDSVYYNEDWLQAAKYVCSPPIRKPADREALWRAIRRGEVQTVSTDHCSFTTQQKLAGRDDFTAIPGGIPGVETRGELIYTFGVAKKKIGLGAMCRVLAENPAKLYGLFPRKGVLAPGSDADIVVYDPNADHVIRAEDMVSAADYNPYEGVVTKGSIRQVWLRGKPAVSSGKVLARPDGKYLPRGKCQL